MLTASIPEAATDVPVILDICWIRPGATASVSNNLIIFYHLNLVICLDMIKAGTCWVLHV